MATDKPQISAEKRLLLTNVEIALNVAAQELEMLISLTPTGPLREAITEVNMHNMSAQNRLKEIM